MAEVDGRVKHQSKTGGRGENVGRKCKPCLNQNIKRAADVFCPSCNEFQCNDCSNGHTIYDIMKDHKLLTVTEGFAYVAKTLDLKGLDVCTKHDKPLEFFCNRDKVLVCSICAVREHKKCKQIDVIDSLAEDTDGQCESLTKKLQQAIINTNCAVEILTEAEQCLYDDIRDIPDQLVEMKKDFAQRFDKFADNVTKEASSYRDKTLTDWAKNKQELENKLKAMKVSFDMIENIAKSGTPSQQFIVTHSMTTSIQTQVKNADVSCADVQGIKVACAFDQQINAFKSNLLSALQPGALDINHSLPKKTNLIEIESIDLKAIGDNERKPGYSGLEFLPDGRLVAVDNQNSKCLLYDENLRLLSAYNFSYHPHCVVGVSDDKVAITTAGNRRLDFLHVSKSNEITLNRTCEVSADYEYIKMNDDGDFVVSAIDHTPPVRIVSMSGEEKDFDIAFPSKKYPGCRNSCTYIHGQDKLVLTDTDDDTVYIYGTTTGDRIAIKDKMINKPLGVTVGPNDHVFVGSKSAFTTSLVEITPAGRVLSSHQVDMKYPHVLVVSKDRKRIAVSNRATGSTKLKLYQIQAV